MQAKEALFIFGLVFIGIPVIGLVTLAVETIMGML